ncbi:MAG: HlyD family efflux transporter periplasmic adaptor subunit [Flavobacteriaceae bacterium]
MKPGNDPIHNLENLIHKNRIKGPSLYLSVLGVIVAVLIMLPRISIDITSQSRGMIRPESESIAITSAVGGNLSYFDMDNNQPVRKGDTLLTISVDDIINEIAQIDSMRLINSRLKDDYTALLQTSYSQVGTTTVREELRAYLTEKAMLENELKSARLRFNRYKKLHSNHVIALSEFEKYEQQLTRASKTLRLFVQKQRLAWEREKQRLAEKLKQGNIRSSFLSSSLKDHYLIAPVDGVLEQVRGLEIGAVLRPSEQVGVISPDGELIAENVVLPRDIGWIKVGQPVRFQLDAFPHQDWGWLEGYVKEIDKNITLNNNQAYFRVFCGFKNTSLVLPNGYKAEISKGMTLTTSYFIIRRNIYSLIFDKLEDWLNPRKLKTAVAENLNR